jgi:hypothetical protein
MKEFRYRLLPEAALQAYTENGMPITFDEKLLNGELIIQAEDQETADKFRMTCTDIRMWVTSDE